MDIEGPFAPTVTFMRVNTVSPPHDVAGMTAFLAATALLECLYLACTRPAGAEPPPTTPARPAPAR